MAIQRGKIEVVGISPCSFELYAWSFDDTEVQRLFDDSHYALIKAGARRVYYETNFWRIEDGQGELMAKAIDLREAIADCLWDSSVSKITVYDRELSPEEIKDL